jgi:hypothetical protein
MPMPSKLDALIVLVTAATGMAMVEDRNRTEIELPGPAQVAAAMTLETCLEQAEYRRRAARVMLILAGGLPDTNPQAPAKFVWPPAETCRHSCRKSGSGVAGAGTNSPNPA